MRQPPSPYDHRVSVSAIAWLKELPTESVPVLLTNHFPRIVNRLARFWDSPRMIDACFEELLQDHRGKRAGFPDEILAEIYALAQYHRALRHPVDLDPSRPARPRRAIRS